MHYAYDRVLFTAKITKQQRTKLTPKETRSFLFACVLKPPPPDGTLPTCPCIPGQKGMHQFRKLHSTDVGTRRENTDVHTVVDGRVLQVIHSIVQLLPEAAHLQQQPGAAP